MAYDDLFKYIGEFGRYQKRIYLLLCLPAISCALHKLAGVFLQAKTNHRCLLPFETDNATYPLPGDLLNMSYPWDTLTNAWSSCSRLDANFTEEYFEGGVPVNGTASCHHWVYDTSKYSSTATSEFDLVCNHNWLRVAADSSFMFGVLIGSLLFGDLSDRFGRRPIFFISLVLQVVGGLLAAIAPEYYTFMLARVLIGATTSGVFLVAYVIAMEMVGPSRRLFAGVVCQMFFTMGFMLTALFAYLIPDWRWLQVALTLPGVVFLCYWWFIPESARWLLANNRPEEAKEILRRVAKENKSALPDDVLDSLLTAEETVPAEKKEEKRASMFDLLKHSNLRKKSLNIFFCWFVNSMTYYGLSWNTSNLGGNEYVNFLISGAVEIPAYTFLLFTLNRWGRKSILCGCMLVAGIALLATLLAPKKSWIIIMLAMIGKLAITASYGAIYVFSAEQFPTVIRNVGLGASSMCARAGSMISPFVNLLGDYIGPLPLVLFGALTLTSGLLTLMLPETLNKKLPDTIEDGEKFGLKIKDEVEDGNTYKVPSTTEVNGKMNGMQILEPDN